MNYVPLIIFTVSVLMGFLLALRFRYEDEEKEIENSFSKWEIAILTACVAGLMLSICCSQ